MTVRWRFTYITPYSHLPGSVTLHRVETPLALSDLRLHLQYVLKGQSRRHGTNSLGNWKVICVMMLYYVSTTQKNFTNTVTTLSSHKQSNTSTSSWYFERRMRLTMIPYPTECQKKHQWSSKLHHYDLGVFLFCCSGSQCNVLPRRHVQINPTVNFFIGEVLLQVYVACWLVLDHAGSARSQSTDAFF